LLSEDQKKVFSYFDEIEKAGPIPREEVEMFVSEIEKCIKEQFEGAE
jgi:hypothetical protein